jgi:hypothetical protein
MITLDQLLDLKESESWVAACGGTEKQFTTMGRTLQYMWNTFTKEHAYYDVTRDVFLENDDLKELGLL